MLTFWKMNGAGNDFVMVDNRDGSVSLEGRQIEHLCDRHRGIGADGLLAVEPARNGADFRMRYYNADGGEAEMCGNGARCFAKFVRFLNGEADMDFVTFETIAGQINATFSGDDVCINLSDPFDLELDASLEANGVTRIVHSVNTGVPHAVVVVDDLEAVEVVEEGAALRHHDRFAPKGTNVNFMQVLEPGRLAIRTYERGVEDETLACGTGMVANAIVHHQLSAAPPPVTVRVKSGETLSVGFEVHTGANGEPKYKNVTLTGAADIVYKGEIELIEAI